MAMITDDNDNLVPVGTKEQLVEQKRKELNKLEKEMLIEKINNMLEKSNVNWLEEILEFMTTPRPRSFP